MALTALALVWSVGLLVAAVVIPFYGSAGTLVDQNGSHVLFVVAVPAFISVIVWIALRRKCSRGGRASGYVAWLGVSALGVFCLLAILTIGVFVIPVAVLLAGAVSSTPSGPLATPAPTP